MFRGTEHIDLYYFLHYLCVEEANYLSKQQYVSKIYCNPVQDLHLLDAGSECKECLLVWRTQHV